MRRIILLILLSTTTIYSQSVDTLFAAQDNTLYESITGDISNGAGPFFFAGVTNSGELRRGLLLFDIANQLPSGSSIDSVHLELWCSKIRSGSFVLDLHRLSRMWGEGSSTTTSQHGQGTTALTPDATWLESMIGGIVPSPWITPGGDFLINSSAVELVDNENKSFRWESNQLNADVQDMLDNPAANNGWLVKTSDESTTGSARQFNSREGQITGGAHAPRLIVYYQMPGVGLEQNWKDRIQLFPNPGNTFIELKGTEGLIELEVQLMDMTGRVIVQQERITSNQRIHTEALPKGVYLVRIMQKGELLTSLRWLKQ